MSKLIMLVVLLLPFVNDESGCKVVELTSSVTDETVNEMILAGWTNNPDDGMEALYSLYC